MNSEKSVAFPNDLLEQMTIEQTLFPSNSDDVGISILSSIENDLHIMRVYQLLLNQSTMVYEPVQEMVSFSFENRSEFVDFLTQLPNLTGLELLILMNPIIPPNQDVH